MIVERVLAAGVVGGEHGEVGEAGGDRAHDGPLRPVPVAAAAEDHDHASVARRSASARAAPSTSASPAGVWA